MMAGPFEVHDAGMVLIAGCDSCIFYRCGTYDLFWKGEISFCYVCLLEEIGKDVCAYVLAINRGDYGYWLQNSCQASKIKVGFSP